MRRNRSLGIALQSDLEVAEIDVTTLAFAKWTTRSRGALTDGLTFEGCDGITPL